jgi:hypothetical protein
VPFVRLLSCFLTVNSSHLPLSARTVGHHKVARLYTVLQVLPPAVVYVDVSNEIRIAALLSLKLAFKRRIALCRFLPVRALCAEFGACQWTHGLGNVYYFK